jgi:hypothetical protein
MTSTGWWDGKNRIPINESPLVTNILDAAEAVIVWWEIECGWGKDGYDAVPKQLRKAVLALKAAKKKVKS